MEYFIVEKRYIIPTVSNPKGMRLVEHKKIDLNNLRNSTGCSKELFTIPKRKQIELNKTGKTSFTVKVIRTIVINK